MEITKEVKDYYGKQIQKTADLKTNACCNLNSYPKKYYQNIHDEIKNSYYGCGLVFLDAIEKMSNIRFRMWHKFVDINICPDGRTRRLYYWSGYDCRTISSSQKTYGMAY